MRKYRMTPEGEKPVWASRRKLEGWGYYAGVKAARGRQPLIPWGNLTYDEAAKKAYEEQLTAMRGKR